MPKKSSWISKRYSKPDPGDILNEMRIAAALNFFKDLNAKKVLDVGCRDGIISKEIGKITGADIYGVDISPKILKIAKRRGIKTFLADIEEKGLPFKNNFFDAVFAGELIEHLYDTDFFLDEVYRVLKPKGVLILTTPNLACWYNRFFLLFGWQPGNTEVSLKHYVGRPFIRHELFKKGLLHGPPGHIHVFTLGALKEFLDLHNFHILDLKGGYGIEPNKVFNSVDRVVSNFPSLARDIIVKAQKV